MIKKYKTVEYALVCSVCGEETLSDSDAQFMLNEARKDGWIVRNRVMGEIEGTCPECQVEQMEKGGGE